MTHHECKGIAWIWHIKVFPQVTLSVPMWYTIRSLINTCSMIMSTCEKVLHEYVIDACKCTPRKGDDVATESNVKICNQCTHKYHICRKGSQNLALQICWIVFKQKHSESIQQKYPQSIQQKYSESFQQKYWEIIQHKYKGFNSTESCLQPNICSGVPHNKVCKRQCLFLFTLNCCRNYIY